MKRWAWLLVLPYLITVSTNTLVVVNSTSTYMSTKEVYLKGIEEVEFGSDPQDSTCAIVSIRSKYDTEFIPVSKFCASIFFGGFGSGRWYRMRDGKWERFK